MWRSAAFQLILIAVVVMAAALISVTWLSLRLAAGVAAGGC